MTGVLIGAAAPIPAASVARDEARNGRKQENGERDPPHRNHTSDHWFPFGSRGQRQGGVVG